MPSKVALITGAGRGIGFATARAFAEAGYSVVIAERC
ncbi:MAG: SDR family NAD(P)-dependent oxidoreductase, partial [Gemmatimonadaceae bacterium]